MSLMWSDIVRWNESSFDNASTDCVHRRKAALEALGQLENARCRFVSTGQTSRQARKRLDQEIRRLETIVAQLNELALALSNAYDKVWQVRTKVLDCEQFAGSYHLIITPSGSVDPNTSGLYEQYAAHQRSILDAEWEEGFRLGRAAELEEMIAQALRLATEADEDLRVALDKIVGNDTQGLKGESSRSHSPGLPNLPPEGWAPSQVARWWSMLSQRDRNAIIQQDPERIGNLDGIDFVSRDRANRLSLAKMLKEAERDYNEFLEQKKRYQNLPLMSRSMPISDFYRKGEKLKETLETLHTIDNILRDKTHPHPIQLAMLDMSNDRCKAVYALGDLDSADHVAMLVPGLGTTVLERSQQYVENAHELKKLSERVLQNHAANESVATVAYLGYDAPLGSDVASTSKADKGADRIASFFEGLQVSREVSGTSSAHTTLFGHSYGSTTAGMSADRIKAGALDDLGLFASPGAGAAHPQHYNISAPHPYVGVVPYPNDMVQGIAPDPYFGSNPATTPGFEHTSSYSPAPGTGSIFGRHSTDVYFDPESQIALDAARIIVGQELEQIGD